MIKIILFSVIFIFFSNPSFSIELKGSFEQGSLIIGKTNATNEIFIDKKKIKVSKDGYFIFGISLRVLINNCFQAAKIIINKYSLNYF